METKHLCNVDPSGLFQPDMSGEGYNNPDEKHTRQTPKGEKGTLELCYSSDRDAAQWMTAPQRGGLRSDAAICTALPVLMGLRFQVHPHVTLFTVCVCVSVRPARKDVCMCACAFFGRFHESYKNVLHVNQHCSPPRGPAVAALSFLFEQTYLRLVQKPPCCIFGSFFHPAGVCRFKKNREYHLCMELMYRTFPWFKHPPCRGNVGGKKTYKNII